MNTSVPLKLLNQLKEIPYSDDEYLLKYQKVVKEYMMKYLTSRGLLLMFETGLGKSITASSIAEEFIDIGRNIIVLAPASLHENMKINIEKYRQVSNITRTGFDNYKFISMNSSNMIKQFSKMDALLEKFVDRFTNSNDLSDKFIIVDECHNLFNSIVNGSKNASRFYDLVMGAKNLKLLFLSGTPVVNTPFELVPCFNMLYGPVDKNLLKGNSGPVDTGKNGPGDTGFGDKGPEKDGPIKEKSKIISSKDLDFRYQTLLPEDYDLFIKSFVTPDFKLKNKEKLQNRIYGMVSYYGQKDAEHFPTYDFTVKEVPMSDKQFHLYQEYREIERAESTKKGAVKISLLTRPQSSSTSTYRVRSRQAGDGFIPNIKDETLIEGNKKININENLHIYSPKLKFILDNLGEGLCVIYSAFVQHTLSFTSEVLKARGISFGVISGDVKAEDRDKLIAKFRAEDNKNGEHIKVLLLSSAGSEGLDLKNVRNLFIFEPHWNYSRIKQIIARAVRYDSHVDLPTELRHVKCYLLLATEPSTKLKDYDASKAIELIKDDDTTTDINIYSRALMNNILIEEFLTMLQESSIDCGLYREKCFMCKPTGEMLFELDFNKDMMTPNPCKPMSEEKATVTEYDISGTKYYKDDKNNIYVYDKDLKGYVELEPGLYGKIIKLISDME